MPSRLFLTYQLNSQLERTQVLNLAPEYQQKLQQAALANQAGQSQNALFLCQQVIQASPTHFQTNLLMAAIYVNLRQFEYAFNFAKIAHQIDGTNTNAAQLLAVIQQQLGDIQGAETLLDASQNGLTTSIYFNDKGYNALLQCQFEKAEKAFRCALVIDPYYPKAHQNLATLLLLQHRFEQGWRAYEWRLRAEDMQKHIPQCFQPYDWISDPNPKLSLKNLRVLIFQEQGVGDTLMFATCILELSKSASAIGIVCEPRLRSLFQRSFPDCQIWDADATFNDHQYDRQLCIGSLPGIFRQHLSNFDATPYLKPDPQLQQIWQSRLAALGDSKKIGISWMGGQSEDQKERRSIPLNHWKNLFEHCNANFINIQHGDTSESWQAASIQTPERLHRFTDLDLTQNLDQMCALISKLDLVICVDNSTVHFAGALGVPTLVLLPTYCDWRWGQYTSASYWYEKLRLIRRKSGQSWVQVLEMTESVLLEFIATDTLPRPKTESTHQSLEKQVAGHTGGKSKKLTPSQSIYQGSPSEDYLKLLSHYQSMHFDGYHIEETGQQVRIEADDAFCGHNLPAYTDHIKQLCELLHPSSYLDYGAGKGQAYKHTPIQTHSGEVFESLAKYWNISQLSCYDPGVIEHNQLPEIPQDLVVNTDVLEHIPEEDIPWILRQLFSCANKGVFASVACYAAKAILPTGENAHVTIKPPEWWLNEWRQAQAHYPEVIGFLCCDLLHPSGIIVKKWIVVD